MTQLHKFRPTQKVCILHNEGYKVCRKKGVKSPAQDLWHANQYIARKTKGMKYVLIMEDDVNFTPYFCDHAHDIDVFLHLKHFSDPFAYNLGILGFVTYPLDRLHLQVGVGAFAQAVIYSRSALDRFETIKVPTWGVHDLLVFSRSKHTAVGRLVQFKNTKSLKNSKRWDCFKTIWLLSKLCGGDQYRLFSLYDEVNSFGGVIPVLSLVVSVTATISCVRKLLGGRAISPGFLRIEKVPDRHYR